MYKSLIALAVAGAMTAPMVAKAVEPSRAFSTPAVANANCAAFYKTMSENASGSNDFEVRYITHQSKTSADTYERTLKAHNDEIERFGLPQYIAVNQRVFLGVCPQVR